MLPARLLTAAVLLLLLQPAAAGTCGTLTANKKCQTNSDAGTTTLTSNCNDGDGNSAVCTTVAACEAACEASNLGGCCYYKSGDDLCELQWRCAAIIALGWLINWALYTAMMCVFVVYCCVLLEVQNSSDAQQAFLSSWLLSVLFRFALQEPAIVLVSFGLPLLFATECLANLCGETVASVLSVAFDTLFVFLSKLAHPA